MIWGLGLAALPWIVMGVVVVFGMREPNPLPGPPGPGPGRAGVGGTSSHGWPSVWPSVRVVVPARNEARNIGACVGSLSSQEYPSFEIVVVDDRSTDGTARLAAAVPPGRARRVTVVSGEELPAGWLGKPWACSQGARGADEDLLLFTDADTVHEPLLLRRTVATLLDDGGDVLSLLGRQELGSFWERLLQPQVFTVLGLRYRRLDRPLDKGRERDAIANGQYILVRRSAYQDVGGHEAVRSEVVEDLRLAQELVAGGHRLILRSAKDALSTRMYQSLREIIDGWTKNLAVGARQSGGWWGRAALGAIVAYSMFVWAIPPAVFAIAGLGDVFGASLPPFLLEWAGAATAIGIVAWVDVYRRRFDVALGYALLYPLGSAFVAFIALRSGWRGERRIEWKGRRYSSGRAQSESG